MSVKRVFLVLVFLFAAGRTAPVLGAQEIPIHNFTVLDGLPDNSVWSMAQEADGRFWVATDKGVSLYSAGRFSSTNLDESLIYMSARVLAVVPDTAPPALAHTLYAGGRARLNFRDQAGRWVQDILVHSKLDSADVTTLFAAGDGSVWVGTNRYLALCQKDSCRQVKTPGLPLPINAIAADPAGRIWVGGESSEAFLFDPQGEILLAHLTAADGLPSGSSVNAILAETPDDTWLGTNFGLIHVCGLKITETCPKPQGLASSLVFSLLPALSGGIWVGTSAGLQRIKDGRSVESFTVLDHLAGPAVYSLSYDLEGNLWAGTNAGLSRLHISAWQNETDPLIALKGVHIILPSLEGPSYVATEQGIVSGRPGETWNLVPGSEGQTFFCLKADRQGLVWAGGQQGLYSIQAGRLVADERVLRGTLVSALLFEEGGTAWVGTEQGLLRLVDAKTALPADNPALADKTVSALWKTSSGDVWVGLSNAGASRLSNHHWLDITTVNSGLPSNFIYGGLEAMDGSIWFATQQGLAILKPGGDPNSGEDWTIVQIPQNQPSLFSPRSQRNGGALNLNELLAPAISSLQVNAVVKDAHKPGMVWVGTDNGLNLIQGDLSSVFSGDDGLSSNMIQALAQTADGRLWVGTPAGLFYHTDRAIAPLLPKPGWKVNGAPYSPDTHGALDYLQKTALVEYQASDLNDLSGIFYRLEIWRQEGNAPPTLLKTVETLQTVYELELAPGAQYTVKVTAFDREMNPTLASSSPALVVKNPTPWEMYTTWPGSPYLTIFVVLLLAFLLRLRAWQTRFRRPIRYDDLLVSVHIAEDGQKGTISGEANLEFSFWERVGGRLGLYPSTANPDPVRADLSLEMEDEIRKEVGQLKGRGSNGQRIKLAGSLMFGMLFGEKETGKLLQRLLDARRNARLPDGAGRLVEFLLGKRRKLRVRLEFTGKAVCLADLPWELLYDGGRDLFLGSDEEIALVRFVALEEFPRREYPEKLRVLVVMAQPDLEADEYQRVLPGFMNLPVLNLAKMKAEFKNIQDKYPNAEIAYLYGPHAATLLGQDPDPQGVLAQVNSQLSAGIHAGNPWDVLHFVGHAGPDPLEEGNPEIVLYAEDKDGKYLPIVLNDLEKVLAALKPESLPGSGSPPAPDNAPALVVLSACQSETFASRLVTTRARGGVGAAVGMRWPVVEDDARQFISAFYDALFHQGQVDYAVNTARGILASQSGLTRFDWAAPVLVTQRKDGFVFEIQKETRHGIERAKHP